MAPRSAPSGQTPWNSAWCSRTRPIPRTSSATIGEVDVPVVLASDGLSAVISAADVPEGENRLTISLSRPFPFGSSSVSRTFTVDRTPPSMTVLAPTSAARVTEAVTLELEVDDAEATVTIDGEQLDFTDGLASKTFDRPPAAPVDVTLADPAGNVSVVPVHIPLALAGEPGQDPIRGVHASGWTWATPELRDPIIQMVEDGLINTVQLDLKDEGGDVWYDTRVQLAHDIGAVTELWDLEQVVEDLHAMDVRVVGRIVNFRDPRLATYAVEQGEMDWVVQNPDGTAYGKYGGFTNPYNEEVWEYNIALAEEAAELGVDDIMYDYVRRPDDYIENIRFPGQDRDPEQAIIDFLEVSQQRVHAAGARLAAAVFGIAATRPDEVAQDIPAIGNVVDYVAPMTYPSHWGPGEYGVDNPNTQPYDIVFRSMEDFQSQLAGTDAGLVIWIQDFSLGVDYGPAEVRAQIDAAADAGVDSFLLWDAATTYTAAALE